MTEKVANIADWRVTLDGKDLSDRLRPRLVSLSLSEKRGDEADQLDIVLSDADGMLGSDQLRELAFELGQLGPQRKIAGLHEGANLLEQLVNLAKLLGKVGVANFHGIFRGFKRAP